MKRDHRLFLVVASIALVFASGCGDVPGDAQVSSDESTATREDPLYYDSTTLWPNRDIGVCWVTTGTTATAAEKAEIRSTLKGQRSWEAAGNINFVGWGSCPNAIPGIEIHPNSSSMSTWPLGYQPPLVTQVSLDFVSPETDYFRCTQNSLPRMQCIQTVALHEFGHALGFIHERNRPDTPPSCTAENDGTTGDGIYGFWDGNAMMNTCSNPTQISGTERMGMGRLYGQRYRDAPRMKDYNGDGRADWLCHNTTLGTKHIDYANSSGQYSGVDWEIATNWCGHDNGRLYTGNFDFDSKSDLLCHDIATGVKWIDYASSSGQFGGTDWVRSANWCVGSTDRLHIGDFNGDSRSDMLCHDTVGGRRWLDTSDTNGQFWGTDWQSNADGWCAGQGKNYWVYVGRFDSDTRADLLCRSLVTGQIWIDYATAGGQLSGTDWTATLNWCAGADEDLYVGDFNGDGRDDLLCHQSIAGGRSILYANTAGQFGAQSSAVFSPWCSHWGARLFVGDFNGDDRDDTLCHDVKARRKWIDYANSSGQLGGTDWTIDTFWMCNSGASEGYELH